MTQIVLMNGVGAASRTEPVRILDNTSMSGIRSVQATVAGTGAVSAVVVIYGCNDPRYRVEVMRFTLSGTGVATDIARDNMPFEFYIAEVLSISGTGAAVSVVAGV